MEELFVFSLLYGVGCENVTEYEKALDTLFLRDPENETLLDLEERSYKDAMLHLYHLMCTASFDTLEFGQQLMRKLKPVYENCALSDFAKQTHHLWSLLPYEQKEEEPFLILSCASDCFYDGDVEQCRKLYECALRYYSEVPVEIKAKCTLDYNAIKAFANAKIYGKRSPKVVFHLSNLSIVLLFFLLVLGMLFSMGTAFLCALVCCAAIIILNCFFYFLLPWFQYQALGTRKGAKFEYVFGEELFTVTGKGKLHAEKAVLKYPMITKAAETPEYLFLYFNKKRVLMVDKSTITGGTAGSILEKLELPGVVRERP